MTMENREFPTPAVAELIWLESEEIRMYGPLPVPQERSRRRPGIAGTVRDFALVFALSTAAVAPVVAKADHMFDAHLARDMAVLKLPYGRDFRMIHYLEHRIQLIGQRAMQIEHRTVNG